MEIVNSAYDFIFRLCNFTATRLNHVVNLDKNVCFLMTELQELGEKKEDVMRQVDQARMEEQNCTSQVKGWLQRVEIFEAEARPLIQDLGQRRQRGICCSLSLSVYKKGKKISKMLKEVRELKGKGDFTVTIADGYFPIAVHEIPSRPTCGLDMMLRNVLQYLEEEEVGIVAIYGMGGVGKTTLLKAVNNEFLTKIHDYDVVIWTLVSREFVADRIQHAIGERLGCSWEGTETQQERASKIYRILRKKRFLLLLDDVWEGLDLQSIGVPFPDKHNKCKVVLTTRSLDVCCDMEAQRKFRVEFLRELEAWQLFSEKVGNNGLLQSEFIRPCAETIVRKCGGLPLALITIARAMANKETVEEWKNAIEVLKRTPSELRGMEDVFSLLKFSYDNLENDVLKSSFLYCALFPEDYSIDKEQLIEYWIGEGFLDSSNDDNVRNRGHDIIGSLKVACLLESGEEKTQVKMHDVVRSFALWIASECGLNKKKFIVEPSMGLNEAPSAEFWHEAQRISLLDNGIMKLSEIPKCTSLFTLLLQWNRGLNKIPDDFFRFMPALRVLDLSFTSLKEIPTSIGNLAELHHLDLSGTKITTLPKELGNLAKLKHLDLQRTHSLRTIPLEAISKLSQLRVLNLYYSYAGWEVSYEGEKEIQFVDLECLRYLTTIGMTVCELTTLERLSGFSILLACIQYLYIKECERLQYLELPSVSSEKLRRLSINNCYDLQYLGVGAGNYLQSLEVLALHGLPNITRVWKDPITQGCLRNLRSVNIWYCHKLKNISWVLQLPKLEVLYIFYCREMEELISGNERVDESKAFPSLRTVSIRDLPELRNIYSSTLFFPSLERIAVIDCPKLKRLSLTIHGGTTLPIIHGTKDWWDKLEWDEDSIRSAFLSQFMAT